MSALIPTKRSKPCCNNSAVGPDQGETEVLKNFARWRRIQTTIATWRLKAVLKDLHSDRDHSGVIATRLATFVGYHRANWEGEQARPCGLMDKAPDFGSGDCRFETCHGRFVCFVSTAGALVVITV